MDDLLPPQLCGWPHSLLSQPHIPVAVSLGLAGHSCVPKLWPGFQPHLRISPLFHLDSAPYHPAQKSLDKVQTCCQRRNLRAAWAMPGLGGYLCVSDATGSNRVLFVACCFRDVLMSWFLKSNFLHSRTAWICTCLALTQGNYFFISLTKKQCRQ